MRFGPIASVLICLAGSCGYVRGETFFGPTAGTNRFLVASNEAVIISSVIANDPLICDVTASNATYYVKLLPTGSARFAVPGPAEMHVPNPCALYLRRLQNTGIRMILLAGGDTTNGAVASVPAGKTVEFFNSLDSDVTPNAYLVKTGAGSNLVQVLPGARVDGPADLRFFNTVAFNVALSSYWFVEDVFQNPNVLVPSQSQTPQIIVEKSGNLSVWQPVALFGQSVGSNTFYRLRILK